MECKGGNLGEEKPKRGGDSLREDGGICAENRLIVGRKPKRRWGREEGSHGSFPEVCCEREEKLETLSVTLVKERGSTQGLSLCSSNFERPPSTTLGVKRPSTDTLQPPLLVHSPFIHIPRQP